MANDPTVKAGSWGARTVEKIVRAHRVRPAPRAADLLAGRLGRRPHHRPGRAVPRPPRRRAHLLQPGEAVGPGAADLLPVRPVGRRRRLHPGVLRHRDHGRGQRLDVPGLAPHGRDGDRRAAPRSRRWAAPACTPPCRAAATTSPSTTPTPSSRPGPASPTCPRTWQERPADLRAGRRPSASSTADDRPGRRHAGLRHARRHRRPGRRRELLRGQAAVRPRADRRASACSTARPVGHRGQQPDAARAARCSSTPPTRRPASSGAATPSTSRWCSWPTCPAS